MSSKIRVFGKTHNRTALGIVNAYLILNPETSLEQMRFAFPTSINPISTEKEMFVDVTKERDPSRLEGYFTLAEELLRMGDGRKVAMQSLWPLESLQRLIEKAKAYGIEVADFKPTGDAIQCKGGYYIEALDNWKPTPGIGSLTAIVTAATIAPVAQAKIVPTTSTVTTTSSTTPKSASSCQAQLTLQTDSDNNSILKNNNSTSNKEKTTMETTSPNSTYDDSNLNWLWTIIGLVVAGLFVWAIYNSYRVQKSFDKIIGSELVAQIQPGHATVEALPIDALPLEVSSSQAQEGAEQYDPTKAQAQAVSAEAIEGQEVDPQVYMARFTELQHEFNGIEYQNANAQLSDSAKHVLNKVAALMQEYPSLDLRIEGHTSSVGRANYNLKLSQQRALAVATYLEGKGIAADRLVAVGMGEAQPVDPANPNGSDNRVTCLFNISHNEARAQKASLGEVIAKEVSEEGPITADF